MIAYFKELLKVLKSIDQKLDRLDRLEMIDKQLFSVTSTCMSGSFIKTGGKYD
jgi:hypothetical protein